MLKKIHNTIIALTIALTPSLLVPAAAHAVDCNASTKNALQCGADSGSGQTNPDSSTASKSIDSTISTGLNLLSVAVGVVAVVMVSLAGFKYITSGGNEEKVKSAKKSLIYALVGLIVVVLAQVIVQFVLKKVTADPTKSTNVTNIPSNLNGQGAGSQ